MWEGQPGAVGHALYVSLRNRNVTKQEETAIVCPYSFSLCSFQYSVRSRKQWINNRGSKYYKHSPEPEHVGRCASTCLARSHPSCLVPRWQGPFPGLVRLCLIRIHHLPLSKDYKTNKIHRLIWSSLVAGGEEDMTKRGSEGSRK